MTDFGAVFHYFSGAKYVYPHLIPIRARQPRSYLYKGCQFDIKAITKDKV